MAKNRLARALAAIDQLPSGAAVRARSLLLGTAVPFAGTAGSLVLELRPGRAVVRVPDRRGNRNHLGGIHAAAMMLAAESAAGFVCGIEVPDDKLLVVKDFSVAFPKRATGSVTATAELDAADRARIAHDDRGDVTVAVRVLDEAGVEPIVVRTVWAFRSARARG